MPRNVSVNSGSVRFVQNISVGPHAFQADEPSANGGNDAGPESHELLLAALGACASITVQMYADRKQWPLEGVHVHLSYVKVPSEDQSDAKTGTANAIEASRESIPSTKRASGSAVEGSQGIIFARHMRESEIIFSVQESPEGGYEARALGSSIFTQADTMDELKLNVREAVRCHFDEGKAPPVIRLHLVKDEVISA